MAKKTKKQTQTPRILNRKARYEYHILEKLEVGIVLKGSEVKSVRNGQVSLAEGFVRIEPATLEMFLHDVDIAPYSHAGPNTHLPKSRRKLLAHKRQIEKLLGTTSAKGTTIVPLAMYFVRGIVKLEIATATGKKDYDKRQTIKSRDADRQIRRGMTRKII